MRRIGELTRQITIQTYSESKDSYGTPVKSWSAHLSNIWAYVEEQGGNEDFETDQKTANDSKVFYVRYRTGITEKMRVLYKSEYFDISKVEVVGQDKYLRITGEAKDSA